MIPLSMLGLDMALAAARGWLLMIAAGWLHHNHIPEVPPIGFWPAVVIAVTVSFLCSDVSAPR